MSSVLPPSFLNYPEKTMTGPSRLPEGREPAPERGAAKKPPIAQQMKEAGALAEASQGDPIHKKKAPDRGDR